ncbi:flavodoxin I [Fontibacillus phaseoli]|uniref:Flavodoxin n=1 Tax=Fontibacillus phaseoli TaxID=1416533 RepID=A0A369B1F4_9BACL|nr:flavodoxin [Fontibacillus phaseoli]RCX15379.1 flavodoxin I [Fontibacillus phaseoli]
MSKIIIIYASLTGNTEEMAELIAEGIKNTGAGVDLKVVDECSAGILKKYDAYLLGTYTWGDGELPDEFIDFVEEMEEVDLKQSVTAVFGSGDTSYRLYCGAVDLLEEKMKELGAVIAQDSLKVEYGPSKEEQILCRQFGEAFAARLYAVN